MMDQEEKKDQTQRFLFLSGTVVHGFGRGSKELNCPTANLDPLMVEKIQTSENPLLFGHSGSGIFFGFAQLVRGKDEECKTVNEDTNWNHDAIVHSQDEGFNMSVFPASASFGFNPCYNNDSKSLEVHLIHGEEIPDFYGSRLKVVLVGKLREECKFDSLQQLIRQIEQDKRNTMDRIQEMGQGARDRLISRLKDSPTDSDFLFFS